MSTHLYLILVWQSTGVEYLPGGVDSGFNKMEKDVFRTRLLHVKGKRTVRVSEASGGDFLPERLIAL